MEERKLNFNAPLMSVRRFSKASSSLVEVNEKKPEDSQLSRRSSFRVSRPPFNLEEVTEQVAVPFHWEQIPGRAKNGSGSASPEVQLPPERTCSSPGLSFGRALEMEACYQNECEANSSNAVVVRLESTKASETRSLVSENDDDDDFSDARETLSLTGSFSINNCSVSGLSGYNGRTFQTDPQTRDFMMSRFLPAAKAIVLEPAKYSLKKQPIAVEQPRQVKTMPSENRRMSPLKQLESTLLLRYCRDEVHEVDGESESVDDEYDNPGNISARGCGLIPNICFKNALGFLSPVPGMRIRTESRISITNEVRESSRTMQHSHSQKINKVTLHLILFFPFACYTSIIADKFYILQHAWDAAGSPKLQEVKNKWIGEPKHFPSSTDLQMRGRSSPFRHSRTASPFRNEASWSPSRKQSLVAPKDVETISNFKGNTNFHDRRSIRETKHGVDTASALIEKTLYIDTASVVELTPPLNSSLLDANEMVDHASWNNETTIETRVTEETITVEPSFPEVKCSTLIEDGKLEREAAESTNKDAIDDDSKMGHGLYKEDLSGYSNMGSADQDEYSTANFQLVKVEHPARVEVTSVISSQPPPLPKSPSESWLWCTLPSVSSKKLLAGSKLGNKLYHKLQCPRTSASTKWETIVKSTNSHHSHVRYSEVMS